MTCIDHNNIVREIPLLVNGSERYNHADSIKHLKLIIAYNHLPEVKPIDYTKLMKGLDKNGVNKGKYQQLTSEELRVCENEGKRIASAIIYLDREEVYVNAERIRTEREALEIISNCVGVDINQEAITILSEPNPIEKFIAAYKKSHVGHYQILRAIVYAECLKSSQTSKGLQPAVTGRRGSGKSHAVRTAVHLLPREGLFRGTLSPMALYHMHPAQKTTFYMDDAALDDKIVATLKRKETEFQEITEYWTQIEKEWKSVKIEKRMIFITTSVGQLGDEQLSDRALLIDIKNEKSDDSDFYLFENARRMAGLPEFEETHDVLLCREMLSVIRNKEFRVILPDLDFIFYHDRRLIGQLYDLVEGSAIFHHLTRTCIDTDGVITVYATAQDLSNALDFDMFKNSDKEAVARLSKTEIGVDLKIQDLLKDQDVKTFTEKDLATKLGVTVPTMRYYLYGKDGTASSVKEECGLCGKTTWYRPDLEKNGEKNSEVAKIHITVWKHMYKDVTTKFAFIKSCEIKSPPKDKENNDESLEIIQKTNNTQPLIDENPIENTTFRDERAKVILDCISKCGSDTHKECKRIGNTQKTCGMSI